MGTEYIDEQFKQLENNRQVIFKGLVKYLEANSIRYTAYPEDYTEHIVIYLSTAKTYSLWAKVVKRDDDVLNLFQTNEHIILPNDINRFAPALVSTLNIWNDLPNNSTFFEEKQLPRQGNLHRAILKTTKQIDDFATDYMYSLKRVAEDTLERMYHIDSVNTFLKDEGCEFPTMFEQYLSGKQIQQLVPGLFEKFQQFAK